MFKAINFTRSFSASTIRPQFARMQLLGSIGRMEVRETKEGVPFLSYSLAVSRYSPLEAEGDKKNVTDWYTISLFDEKALNFFQSYLAPGAQIYVDAEVKQRAIVDEAGNRLYVTNLKQTGFDVVRFPRKDRGEESAEEVAE